MKYIIFLMINLLISCSTVDLKKGYSAELFTATDNLEKTEELIKFATEKQGNYSDISTLELYGIDIWNSWFVWMLTPCTEMKQEFRTLMNSKTEDIEYTYQNGRKKGQSIGIQNGKEYNSIDGKKNFSESSLIRIYIRPMFNYFHWSHRILNQQHKTYLGKQFIGSKNYHLIYLSPSDTLSDTENQYIAYIDTESGNIDFLEFTLREMMKTYKGVIRYKSYRKIEGVSIPFEIEIADSIQSKSYVHKLIFSNISIQR